MNNLNSNFDGKFHSTLNFQRNLQETAVVYSARKSGIIIYLQYFMDACPSKDPCCLNLHDLWSISVALRDARAL
jgi:hypothetical protein